jgi:hypothetical protein
MPTLGNGVGAIAHKVAEHASALVRLETELATLELRRKAASVGTGAALVAAAGIVGLFTCGFMLAALAAALGTFLPSWLALLFVALGLLMATATLGAVGVSRLRRGVPPVPEQAVEEAKLTAEALRGTRRD